MNILMVEDETRVADFVRRGLVAEGWTVEHAPDAETALDLMKSYQFDVILLDLILPGMSGQDFCRQLRARGSKLPILMLSALDATDERVAGLRLGADDYLAKPFNFDELVARIQALRRRATDFEESTDEVIDCGDVRFERRAHIVTIEGEPIDLSSKEMALLLLLIGSRGRAFSRERILNAVWGLNEDPLTNVVDVYIGRLRRRLGQHGHRIVTLRNLGYRFD